MDRDRGVHRLEVGGACHGDGVTMMARWRLVTAMATSVLRA
jgi:hypothetical protein